jgi:hypothetical protein
LLYEIHPQGREREQALNHKEQDAHSADPKVLGDFSAFDDLDLESTGRSWKLVLKL